jgi:hypothetical protein
MGRRHVRPGSRRLVRALACRDGGGEHPPRGADGTYTGAFAISVTTTMRYRSWDVAGNVENVQSRKIMVT